MRETNNLRLNTPDESQTLKFERHYFSGEPVPILGSNYIVTSINTLKVEGSISANIYLKYAGKSIQPT